MYQIFPNEAVINKELHPFSYCIWEKMALNVNQRYFASFVFAGTAVHRRHTTCNVE